MSCILDASEGACLCLNINSTSYLMFSHKNWHELANTFQRTNIKANKIRKCFRIRLIIINKFKNYRGSLQLVIFLTLLPVINLRYSGNASNRLDCMSEGNLTPSPPPPATMLSSHCTVYMHEQREERSLSTHPYSITPTYFPVQ